MDEVWVTEGIRPGIVAVSHHLGRWRLAGNQGGTAAFASPVADLVEDGDQRTLALQAGVGGVLLGRPGHRAGLVGIGSGSTRT